ncbi:hypothetical protein DFH09DRAFT_1433084 [Mycena vulgaris]|nr:hypothetical protein DFH09DRAFT_1433084 [Mycena vulgaris]
MYGTWRVHVYSEGSASFAAPLFVPVGATSNPTDALAGVVVVSTGVPFWKSVHTASTPLTPHVQVDEAVSTSEARGTAGARAQWGIRAIYRGRAYSCGRAHHARLFADGWVRVGAMRIHRGRILSARRAGEARGTSASSVKCIFPSWGRGDEGTSSARRAGERSTRSRRQARGCGGFSQGTTIRRHVTEMWGGARRTGVDPERLAGDTRSREAPPAMNWNGGGASKQGWCAARGRRWYIVNDGARCRGWMRAARALFHDRLAGSNMAPGYPRRDEVGAPLKYREEWTNFHGWPKHCSRVSLRALMKRTGDAKPAESGAQPVGPIHDGGVGGTATFQTLEVDIRGFRPAHLLTYVTTYLPFQRFSHALTISQDTGWSLVDPFCTL